MKKIIFLIVAVYSFLHAEVQLSKNTYNTLLEVQKLSADTKYEEALKLLDELLSKDIKKADQAYLLQSKGFILTSLNRYEKAIKAFEDMNSLEVMDKETSLRVLYNLAQLTVSIKEYKKSIHYIKEYISQSEQKNPDAYILLAQNYLLIDHTKKAIPNLVKAIEIKKTNKQDVLLSWYDLLFSSYYKVKDYDNAIKSLETMVRLNPVKKEYWQYLYQLYTIKNDLQKGLNLFEQAYNLELLEGKDIVQFAGFLASNNLYFKSAELLEKHMRSNDVQKDEKNLTLLYTLYYTAKEYSLALKTLENLVKVSNKSEHYLEKARIHNMIHQHHQAIEAYQIALKDKSLKNYPKVMMELAYLYYELENHTRCKECLHIAKDYEQTKQKALKFLEHI